MSGAIKSLVMRPNTVRQSQKFFYDKYLHGVESFRAHPQDMYLNGAAMGLTSVSLILSFGGVLGMIFK